MEGLMKKEQKVIYYTNESEDEFSSAQISAKKIDEKYSYRGGFLRRVGRVVLYYGLARPLGFLFLKIKYGHKIVNKEVLMEAKGKGYFLYGNHTNAGADPFIPQFVDVNRSVYFVVHPNNVSMPVLGHLTPALGAIPLPDTMEAARNCHRELERLTKAGNCIVIYPEAHIWPYYTGIRFFKSASFGYPIQFDAPVYCFTNTYVKRKHRRIPGIVTYVDGPFCADKSLPKSKQKEQLRDAVYETMVKRSKNSNIEYIRYEKKEMAESE